jgi:hypothetical protein
MSAYSDAVERIARGETTAIGPEIQAVMAAIERLKPSHLMTEAELAAKQATEASATRLADRRRRLHDSGIVRVIANPGRDLPLIVHEQLKETPALAIVRTWWAEGDPVRPWLFVSGTTGIGKTWAAAWLLADSCRPSRYVTASGLTRAYASSSAALGPMQRESADREWRAIVDAPTLVVDELGREPLSTVRSALHALVDERGSSPTLVLSNVASTDLRSAFADGSLDRRTCSRLGDLALRDPSGKACWDLTGADMRGRWEAK